MNKKLTFAACYCLPLLFPVGCSCDDYGDYEPMEHVLQISVSGMEFNAAEYNDLMGDAPAEGITFTVTISSEESDLDCLYASDRENYYIYELTPLSDFTNNWGSIKFITKEEPYQIEVTINENDTANDRWTSLCFGNKSDFRQLVIYQPPL